MADGFIVIDAPPAAAPRVGLITSANRPTPADGWQNGIRFVPEAYLGDDIDQGGGSWEPCSWDNAAGAAQTVVEAPDKGEGPPVPDQVSYLPWTVVEADECLARASTSDRALRRLVANRSRKVEREFWLGLAAQAGNLPNDYLANPATADDIGTAGLIHALAALAEYLDGQTAGRGMIHASKRVAYGWVSAGLVRREGALWLDPADNIVVTGPGYDGSGPGGDFPAAGDGQEWAYATGVVQYLEDSPTTHTETASVARRNRQLAVAEQTVAAFHDGLAHGALLVDISDSCAVGAGAS